MEGFETIVLGATGVLAAIFIPLAIYNLSQVSNLNKRFDEIFDSILSSLDSAFIKASFNLYLKFMRNFFHKLIESGVSTDQFIDLLVSQKEALQYAFSKLSTDFSSMRLKDQDALDIQQKLQMTLDDFERDEFFQITESTSSLYSLQTDLSDLQSKSQRLLIEDIRNKLLEYRKR
jgi:hypothetical protein